MNRFRRILDDVLFGTFGPTEVFGSKWIVLPPALAMILLVGVLFRQLALGLPVPTRPLPGEVAHGRNVMFAWNAAPEAAMQVQMGPVRSFNQVLYAKTTNPGVTHIRARGIFDAPGEYFWRVRAIHNGSPGRWTRPIKFRVE